MTDWAELSCPYDCSDGPDKPSGNRSPFCDPRHQEEYPSGHILVLARMAAVKQKIATGFLEILGRRATLSHFFVRPFALFCPSVHPSVIIEL